MQHAICLRLFTLLVCLPLAACSKTPEGSPKATNTSGRPMCLGYLLLEPPHVFTMGDGGGKGLNSTFGGRERLPGADLEGVNVGAKGFRWQGIDLSEIAVGTLPKHHAMSADASRRPERFARVERGHIEKNLPKRMLIERDWMKDEPDKGEARLKELQAEIDKGRADIAVSGKANLKDDTGFAYRWAQYFLAGIYDTKDSRTRLIAGEVSHPEMGVQAAAWEYERFNRIYSSRLPTDIPKGTGFCTGYGFIAEDAKEQENASYNVDVVWAMLKHYPNLIFKVNMSPLSKDSEPPQDIREEGDPNKITVKDIQKMTGMGAVAGLLSMAGVKHTFGPEYIEVAGQTGRIVGREYYPNSGFGAAYEFEFKANGVPGQRDKPYIKITMAAALPDPEPLPAGQQSYNPALKGTKPPKVEVGEAIFRQVIQSLRIRPQEVATH